MKQHSMKKIITTSFLILLAVLLLITVLYGGYSLRTYEQMVLNATGTQLDAYASRLAEELSSMADFNKDLVANDTDFNLLSYETVSDNQKILSTHNLRRILISRTLSSEISILYEPTVNGLYYHFGDFVYSGSQAADKRVFVNLALQEIAEVQSQNGGKWVRAVENGPFHCMMLVNRNRNLYLASVMNLDSYVSQNPIPTFSPASISVVTWNQEVLYNADKLAEQKITPANLAEKENDYISLGLLKGYICRTAHAGDTGISVSVLIPLEDMGSQIAKDIGYFLLVILLIIVTMAAVNQVFIALLYYPLKEAAEMSGRLESGSEDLSGSQSRYTELTEISKAMLSLADQKTRLQIEKDNQQMAAERAMFQFYQLQTRSHFFQNCLKSLFNMTERGDKGKMQTMIMAFSNHLRYIFRDSMEEVTLESELHEASDYHRIISMDSSRPIIMTITCPDELLDVYIPPLMIQTFLENTYKYNGKTEGTITFTADIAQAELEGETYLRVRTADNGAGYPQELLKTLNAEPEGSFDTQNIGLNNLKRRANILYKDKCRFAFYNTGNGACSSVYIPLHRKKVEL